MLSYRICCRAHSFKELKCSFISYFSGGAVATTPWHEQVAKHVPCRKQRVGHCCHSGWPTAAVKKTTVVIGSLWDHINTYLYRKVRRSSMSLIRLTVVSLDSLSCVLHCVLGALQLWHSSNPTLTPFFSTLHLCVLWSYILYWTSQPHVAADKATLSTRGSRMSQGPQNRLKEGHEAFCRLAAWKHITAWVSLPYS